MIHKLLTRTQFNENTFKRDNYKCVFCSDTKIVAHHIDRKLWDRGKEGKVSYFIEVFKKLI